MTERSPPARSTTTSTPTLARCCAFRCAPTRRSPPQPKPGCSACRIGATAIASTVACGVEPAGDRAVALLPGDAAPAQRCAEHLGAAGIDADAHGAPAQRTLPRTSRALSHVRGGAAVERATSSRRLPRQPPARCRRRRRARLRRRARRRCAQPATRRRRRRRGALAAMSPAGGAIGAAATGAPRARRSTPAAAARTRCATRRDGRAPFPDDVASTRSSARPSTSTSSRVSVASSGVVAAAAAPAAARLADANGRQSQAPCLQLAVAGELGQRPAMCAAHREAAGQRRRGGARPHRRAVEAATSGASASRRGASTRTRQSSSLAPRAAIVPSSWMRLPPATRSSAGRARRPVGEPCVSVHRNAGDDAVDDGEAGAPRRRRQRGVEAVADPLGRHEEIELALGVDPVRAARRAANRCCPATTAPGRSGRARRGRLRARARSRPCGRERPASVARASPSEASTRRSSISFAPAPRVEANARRLRRRARQSRVGELAGEIGAEVARRRRRDAQRGARAPAREAGPPTGLAADDRVGCARIERGRPDRAQLGVEAPGRGVQRPRPTMLPAAPAESRARPPAPARRPRRAAAGERAARRGVVAPAGGPRSSGRRARWRE